MKFITILLGAASQLALGSVAYADHVKAPQDETVPMTFEEILAWNLAYRGGEPSALPISESQVGGPPVLPPKAPAYSYPEPDAAVYTTQRNPTDPPKAVASELVTASDDIVIEDDRNSRLVPVLEPKRDPKPEPINRPKNTLPAFNIGLPLLLDERYLGDVTAKIAGESVSIPIDRTKALIGPDLSADFVAQLEAAAIDGFLEVGGFALDGLSVKYNPQLQQIEFKSENDIRDVRVLRLGVDRTTRRGKVLMPAKISAFVTPTVSSEYYWDGDDPNADNNLSPFGTVDLGGRIGGEKGVAFLSRHSFDTRGDFDISRDETQLVYDVLPRLMRFTAGDLRPRGEGFQAIPNMAGLSVERFFELEPNRLFRATSQSSFELERPSTVEIRINGVTQREIFLQPGRYNLQDLPLVQGSNLVDLVIRDDLGRERIISDRNFFDFNLLEKGIWDYSLSAGVRSDRRGGEIDYTDEPVVTGFLRGGISNTLTLGMDVQGDNDGVNGGGSLLWASPVGVVRATVSASEREGFGTGGAAELGLNATGYFGETGRSRWTATVNGRYTSDRFTVLPTSAFGIGAADEDILQPVGGAGGGLLRSIQPTQYNANGSFQVSQDRWSLTANANYSQFYADQRDSYDVLGGINYTVSPSISVGAFARHVRSTFEEETGFNFQVIWRPGRNRDVRARYDTLRNEAELSYRKTAPFSVGALGYGVSAISNFDSDSLGLAGDATYIGNRFEALARHDIFTGDETLSGETRQISRATVRSSIAFADGAVAVGRPLSEAFAIVKRHETLDGKTVYVNPTERGYSASSGALGSALASQISPFAERSIYYDVEDLPAGYDLGEGQINVRPPLNAGYKVEVGSKASFTIIGRVIDKKTGARVPYIGGRLESLDDPDAEPVLAFTNRNGRLAAVGLKSGRYTLILLTEPEYRKTITISDDGKSLVDIGEVYVAVKE